MKEKRPVFVFEPLSSSRKRTSDLVNQAGYDVLPVGDLAEAQRLVTETACVAALVAYEPQGVELCAFLRRDGSERLPVGALINPNVGDVDGVITDMQADGFLRRPFTVSTVESFLGLARRLSEARRRESVLCKAIDTAEIKLARGAVIKNDTGFHEFETVKDILITEVRRAKRYSYPIVVLLVALDPLPQGAAWQDDAVPRQVTAALAHAIAKSIRVVDIPIQCADDRIIVFFPHTDLAGGEEIGRRIKRRIKRIAYRGPESATELSASVGVAALEPGDALTFAKLMKNAAHALKAAQLKGGDRVMKFTPGRAS